ncbi:MAG: divalent-cation tolerance protein CutA [Rickettsiaceae bacterium]|nr:divalent-cation tolerance protein CutA [Rickettsiaceae bacterium]
MSVRDTAAIIQTSTNEKSVALKISMALLESKKAACVHISEAESFYSYQGKIVNDKEFVLTIKTMKSRVIDAMAIIKANHNYHLPEIIEINIDEASSEYFAWLSKETAKQVAN